MPACDPTQALGCSKGSADLPVARVVFAGHTVQAARLLNTLLLEQFGQQDREYPAECAPVDFLPVPIPAFLLSQNRQFQ